MTGKANRHNIRYYFEHKLLPQWFYDKKEQLVGAIIHDKSILFRVIDDIFNDEEIDNPYKEDDFDISKIKISDDVMVLKLIFPEPEEEPLCYCSYLLFDINFEKISYFCIEKGNELSQDQPFVCSWTSDGSHLNHGNCTFEEDNDLMRCAAVHLQRFYE